MTDRYKVKPALYEGETVPYLYFIRDTETGELVRGKNHVLRSFKKERDAQRAVDALNSTDLPR